MLITNTFKNIQYFNERGWPATPKERTRYRWTKTQDRLMRSDWEYLKQHLHLPMTLCAYFQKYVHQF